MQYSKIIIYFLFIISTLCHQCYAQGVGEVPSTKVDVVLLLDASGSMLLSDPNRTRDMAVEKFAAALGKDDRLAIIAFAEKAVTVLPLSLVNSNNLTHVRAATQAITNTGIYTDIASGLDAAIKLLKKYRRPEAQASIILFSDGKIDPNPEVIDPETSESQITRQILPAINRQKMTVHTIGFSKDADKNILEIIAYTTNGNAWFTEKTEDFNSIFGEILKEVKKDKTINNNSFIFTINEKKETTIYIENASRKEDQLKVVSPIGEIYIEEKNTDYVKWFKNYEFTLITLKEPMIGKWELLDIDSSKGFISVMPDLNASISFPSNTNVDRVNDLIVQLYDGTKPVLLDDLANTFKVNSKIVRTDEVTKAVTAVQLFKKEKKENDKATIAVYTAPITFKEEGKYKLEVDLIAPTFTLSKNISFTVKERLVSIELVSLNASNSADDLAGTYFEVKLAHEVIRLKDQSIKLMAKQNDSVTEIPLMISTKRGRFLGDTKSLPNKGEYFLNAVLKAKYRGVEFEAHSQTLKYNSLNANAESVEPEKEKILPTTAVLAEVKEIKNDLPVEEQVKQQSEQPVKKVEDIAPIAQQEVAIEIEPAATAITNEAAIQEIKTEEKTKKIDDDNAGRSSNTLIFAIIGIVFNVIIAVVVIRFLKPAKVHEESDSFDIDLNALQNKIDSLSGKTATHEVEDQNESKVDVPDNEDTDQTTDSSPIEEIEEEKKNDNGGEEGGSSKVNDNENKTDKE